MGHPVVYLVNTEAKFNAVVDTEFVEVSSVQQTAGASDRPG